MNKSRIKITLLSDLCCYSGEVYNSTVDIDCVYDKYGIPYIPAKRIKGCIREAALELQEIGILSEQDYKNIFENENVGSSIFTISNARIEDYDDVVKDIRCFNKNGLCEQQKIFNLYTYTRTQTKIDERCGSAEDNSLRTMRVVKKGLVFYADIEFNDKEEKYFIKFEQAVKMVKHMGLSRTRGLGLVELSIVSAKNNNNSPKEVKINNEDDVNDKINKKISYIVETKSPVICKSPAGNQAVTEDYISGSKILGLIAGKLNEEYQEIKNNIIVSNAYIASENNNAKSIDGKIKQYERCLPAKCSLEKEKDEDYKNNKLSVNDMLHYNTVNDELPTQRTHVDAYYLCETNEKENGSIIYITKSIDTEISYHHQRPCDKSIGRPDEEEGEFYQLASISEEQVFKGDIYINKLGANKVLERKNELVESKIGYGKNNGFGEVCLTLELEDINVDYDLTSCKDIQRTDNGINEFDLVFLSDAILYNEYGMPDSSLDVIVNYLNEFFGLTNENQIEKDDIKKSYLSYNTIGGFNVTWKCKKQVFTSISKGSVIHFNLKKESIDAIERKVNVKENTSYFIGERIFEGYGEIRFTTKNETKIVVRKDIDNDYQIKNIESRKQTTDIVQLLLEKEFEKEVEQIVRKKTNKFFTNSKTDDLILAKINEYKPAIAKIRLLYKSQINIDSMRTQINGMKNSNQEKCSNLLKILEKILEKEKRESTDGEENNLKKDENEEIQNINTIKENISQKYNVNFDLKYSKNIDRFKQIAKTNDDGGYEYNYDKFIELLRSEKDKDTFRKLETKDKDDFILDSIVFRKVCASYVTELANLAKKGS